MRVYGVGEVPVRIKCPQGVGALTLKEVAYIPEFQTNLVSFDRLIRASFVWDTMRLSVHYAGQSKTIFYLCRDHEQYIIEYNDLSDESSDSTPEAGFQAARRKYEKRLEEATMYKPITNPGRPLAAWQLGGY